MKLKKRIVALVTAATMLCSVLPVNVLALEQSNQEETGLCQHHQQHDENCGYVQAKEASPCLHEHDDNCYIVVTHCTHQHSSECYKHEQLPEELSEPSEAIVLEASNCTHQCSEEEGCIEKILDCKHVHDESCGYSPEVLGSPCTYVCQTCNQVNSEPTNPSKLVISWRFLNTDSIEPVYNNDCWELSLPLDSESESLSIEQIKDLLPKQLSVTCIDSFN